MNGKDLKRLIKINGLIQEDAAKLFGVSRQTINVWCKMEELPDKIVKLVNKHFSSKNSENISITGNQNVNVNGDNVNSPIDNRQYYSDSPDVLRAQIDELERLMADKEERIKEKDAQIKEKDAQIHRLLSIVEASVSVKKEEK